MHIITLPRDSLALLQPLWEQLNAHHMELSTHFKEHHRTFTFSERIEKLRNKKRLQVFVAFEEKKPIGYCIVSASGTCGEIDSLFVIPEARKNGVGRKLMLNTLDWMKEQQCQSIAILVAEGNEKAFSFYEQFGFKPKATLLRMLTDLKEEKISDGKK